MEWKAAYEKANFYRSGTNEAAYWDKVAKSDSGGLTGQGHIDLIRDYLIDNNMLGGDSHVLDIGCGGGDYVLAFAEKCGHVTAMDYSAEMLAVCRKRCEDAGLANVSYRLADFSKLGTDQPEKDEGGLHQPDAEEKYDCVMSCLNPATYHPAALEKMLSMATRCVVYFSMDIPIEEGEKEPVYCGCNSVRYAEQYLRNHGLSYQKLPYVYAYQMPDGQIRDIPFAFLVISLTYIEVECTRIFQ